MTDLQHVFDGTAENFQQLVVENSARGPVLVNYWTPKAGPCFKLWEVLKKLSQEYQGRFLLVNINTDTQRALVRESGVTSVPTLKIYSQGRVVESIHGAQSEGSIRAVLNKYIPALQGGARLDALRAYQAGRPDDALEILQRAAGDDPRDHELPATALKLLLREKRYEEAVAYFAGLPDAVRENQPLRNLATHAELLRRAELAPALSDLDRHLSDHAHDLDAIVTRAAVAMIEDDYGYALECLFHAFREDRDCCDGLPQKAMLSLFDLLGRDHPLTRDFQQRLREYLH
jgi:putative thioredoxin